MLMQTVTSTFQMSAPSVQNGYSPEPPAFCAQDVNQDGHVNISDIGKIGQWWLISYTRIGS